MPLKKAVILTTYLDDDIKLIPDDIYKLALNYSPHKADKRMVRDSFALKDILSKFPEDILVIGRNVHRCETRAKRIDLHFSTGVIISAIDYCKTVLKCDEILLVADNKAHLKEFQSEINDCIKYFDGVYLYQVSKGNFKLPVKSIKDFINGD